MIDAATRETPWHTDRWFTSPWNFDEDALRHLQFASGIQIHDVTLRDGEQQAGVIFTAEDKIRIAEALAEAGVQRIEAGMPAVSDDDEQAIKAIASMGLPAHIFAFSRCMVEDVKRAVDCGVSGVVMEIPVSSHLIELGYRWGVDRAIEASVEATRYAHEQGLYVSFFPIDATRAGMDEYVRLVGTVAEQGHMDALGLVDTFGVLAPHAVARFVEESRVFGVPLETHFHMDMGLGVANSLIAAAAGAQVLQTTVGGIGERAGNTPMEETVVGLLTMYGKDIGIRTERLTGLHRLVMTLAGVEQPSNRPVTGSRLFQVESGIPATFYRNTRDVDITEAFPYVPSLVGQEGPEIVLGKGSGPASIEDVLERLGLPVLEEGREELVRAVKAKAIELGRLLVIEEFLDLVKHQEDTFPEVRRS